MTTMKKLEAFGLAGARKNAETFKEGTYVLFKMIIYLFAVFHETRVHFGYSVLSEAHRGDGAEV